MKKINLSNLLTALVLVGVLYFIYDYMFNRAPKFIVGAVAPDFEGKTPEGETLKLSDYRGKIVLLDFWGTWCAPCLAEIPELVRIYNTYKDANFDTAQGFEILAVAMDKDKATWENMLQARGMNWSNVSDLKRMKGDIGTLYNVREIPTKYLINEKGVIISVNPTTEDLEKILAQKQQ